MLQIPLVVPAIGLTALTAAGSSGIRNEIIAIARDNLAAFEQVIRSWSPDRQVAAVSTRYGSFSSYGHNLS
jgi:hypothetical protein